jgi:rhodanese-related sulfurtransferase
LKAQINSFHSIARVSERRLCETNFTFVQNQMTMKFLLTLSLLFMSWTLTAQTRLNQTEFKAKMKAEKVQILDVRTAKEVAEGKIDGAWHIDYFSPEFLQTAEKSLDKKTTVLIYCAYGVRSQSAMKDLKKAGFKVVYYLIGGYDAWKE